jgi:hypothetical protein
MDSRYRKSTALAAGSTFLFIFITCLFWYKDGLMYALPYVVLTAAMIIGSYPAHCIFKIDYQKSTNPLRIISYILIIVFAVWAGYNTVRLF